MPCLARVVLPVDRDQDRRRIAALACLHRLAIHLVDLAQQRLPPIGCRLEQADRRDQLVVDDVAQGPAAAEPRARVLGSRVDVGRRGQHAAGVAAAAAAARCGGVRLRRRAALRALLFDRRRDAHARHLRQQADLVVPPAAPGHRALPEVRVGRVVDDALFARRFERRRLRLSEDAVPAVDQRMHVRVDGIGRRHHEDARAVAAHLVLVEPHRRIPVVPQQLRRQPALLLREHVHVAVVVVADVRVVEERNRAVGELGAGVLVEPVGHHDLPVRVEARHQDEDDVVEHLPRRRRVVCGQPMHQLEGHLRGADLGRVNAAGHEHHRLAAAEDLVALGVGRRPSLEIELPLELLVAVDVLQGVRRADLQRNEGLAVGRLAELAQPHAIGRLRRQLHVFDDAVPADELVVGADGMAGELLGGGQRRLRPDRRGSKEDHCGEGRRQR